MRWELADGYKFEAGAGVVVWHRLDISAGARSDAAVAALLDATRPCLVVHAAIAKPHTAAIVVDGVLSVLTCAMARGVRCVLLSTDSVFPASAQEEWNEESPLASEASLRPNHYSLLKRRMELAVAPADHVHLSTLMVLCAVQGAFKKCGAGGGVWLTRLAGLALAFGRLVGVAVKLGGHTTCPLRQCVCVEAGVARCIVGLAYVAKA